MKTNPLRTLAIIILTLLFIACVAMVCKGQVLQADTFHLKLAPSSGITLSAYAEEISISIQTEHLLDGFAFRYEYDTIAADLLVTIPTQVGAGVFYGYVVRRRIRYWDPRTNKWDTLGPTENIYLTRSKQKFPEGTIVWSCKEN